MSKLKWIVSLAIITLVFSILDPTATKAQTTTIPAIEKEALIALYNSTDGDNWNWKYGWLTDPDPCTWGGITCEEEHVSEISLQYNNLFGGLPSEIGNLTNLNQLFLGGNQLTNLPPEIGNLTNLGKLYFDDNQLTNLPPEIGNLTWLVDLDLSSNQLTSLPPEIGNLPTLDLLRLCGNQLTSLPPEIGNLTNLYFLDLSNNQLTSLPSEIGNLTNFGYLFFDDNQLTSLPPEIGNLTNLEVLFLGNNQLTSLPPEIGNLLNLRSLYLSNNQLTSLPSEIGNLMNSKWLYLGNNQLTSLPPEIGNLINLHHLDLSDNALSGEIPHQITNLDALRYCPYLSYWECYLLWDPFTGIGYNMLYTTNPSVSEFMIAVDPDWAETQTIAPSAITETDATPTSVELSWTPIPYTGDGGYYQIGYSEQVGGPYTIHGSTSDKTASSYTADGLTKHNSYYFVVQTYTPAHDEQKNELLSDYSMEVEGIPRVFWDVLPTHWALPFVETIYEEGITTGCYADPLMYCPEENTTRAETAVFLEKGIHGAGFFPPDVMPTFGDTAGHWAEDWIEALYNDGLTSGCSQDPLLYCPDSNTTRGEMAVFLLKAKHGNTYTPPPASGGAFSDVAGHWAESWIEQLAAEGITSGYPDGTFKPDKTVTRAEMAVFLVNTFGIPLP